MKKTVLLIVMLLALSTTLSAQRVGYINSQTILNEMPEYISATQQIDRLRKQYESQVQAEMKKVEELYKKYQQDKNLLSQQLRSERENQIITLERSAKELQRELFGQEGAMAVRSKELIEPIMNRLQTVVKEVADREEIIMVFDISTLQGIIYNNTQYDLTQKVLTKLKE